MSKGEITLRDICDILDIEKDVPVFYEGWSDIKGHLIWTECWPKDMVMDINNKRFDSSKSYDKSKIGIHVYNSSIQEFVRLQKIYYSVDFRNITEELRSHYGISKEDCDLAFSIFCILHEKGHWFYYMDCRDGSKKPDEQLYLEYFQPLQDVESERENIFQMYEAGENESNIYMHERVLSEKYRDIPAECKADQYAYENIKDALYKVKERLDEYHCE